MKSTTKTRLVKCSAVSESGDALRARLDAEVMAWLAKPYDENLKAVNQVMPPDVLQHFFKMQDQGHPLLLARDEQIVRTMIEKGHCHWTRSLRLSAAASRLVSRGDLSEFYQARMRTMLEHAYPSPPPPLPSPVDDKPDEPTFDHAPSGTPWVAVFIVFCILMYIVAGMIT